MKDMLKIPMDYSVYCFDIFDTIISRTVQPEHVKKIWSKEIQQVFRVTQNCNEIYSLRNGLEAELCKKNEDQGYCLEFQYEMMLNELYDKLNINDSKDEFIRKCYDIELEIEKRNQILCQDTVLTIKELKNKGKRIYCVSDFYTPKKFIASLFKYHNIYEYIDDFFVSSECLLTKRDGRLYDYVLKELNLNASEVFMIGDNKWSDVDSAKNHNIMAYHIDRTEQHNKYKAFEEQNRAYKAEENIMRLYKKCKRNEYEDLTFTLYHFIEKLFYELQGKNIRNVFFLSREGEFLKKLFDFFQLQRIMDESERIKTHYLMVSRKATLMVSLKPLEYENFEMIFRQYINISLYDFLSSLGFLQEEQEQLGSELGVDIHEKKADFPRDEVYEQLRSNVLFQKLYEDKRNTQNSNFTKYLNSFGVDFETENLCLVDVGWKGTIQDNLLVYFQGAKKIEGFYLGLVAAGKEHENNIKSGLLFDCVNRERSDYFDVYNENKSIFEVVLGATHGSADSYETENGEVVVKTSQREEERELFISLISPIQEKIFALFQVLDNELINRFYDISSLESVWAGIQARLVFLPTSKQIDIFYKIYHFENFGIFEFTKFKTNEHISIRQRLKNLRRLLKEKSRFFGDSFWRIVALRDAGLSVFIKPYGYYLYNQHYMNRGE